jgi:hypothetical protein
MNENDLNIERARRRIVAYENEQYRQGKAFSIVIYWVHDETIVELLY